MILMKKVVSDIIYTGTKYRRAIESEDFMGAQKAHEEHEALYVVLKRLLRIEKVRIKPAPSVRRVKIKL